MQPEQRKAGASSAKLAAAVLGAVLAAVGLSGCTGSDADPGTDNGKSGVSGRATTVQPGKYRTLPDACGAVSGSTLRELLPTAEVPEDDEEAQKEQDKLYAGHPAVTYDSDRRVGCRWTVETPEGSRHLTLDFERVVSYDVAVSDDDRATAVYEKKAEAAHVPAGAGSGAESGSGSGSASSGGPSASSTSSASSSSHAPSHSPSSASSDPSSDASPSDEATGEDDDVPDLTAPRRLDDLADDAYLDDKLATSRSEVKRRITVVFRSSNVIATLTYDQVSRDKTRVPSSEELQGNALDLAGELTGRLDE